MLISYEGTSIDPHLELVAIDDDAWRLSDGRIPEDDARRILGLVERHEHCYRAMWLHPSAGESQEFASIAEALAAASERMQRRAVAG